MAVSEGIMKTKDAWSGGGGWRAGRKGVERGEIGQQFTVLTCIRVRHRDERDFKLSYCHIDHLDPYGVLRYAVLRKIVIYYEHTFTEWRDLMPVELSCVSSGVKIFQRVKF
jgi:hypothetical protein